jgi:phospholipid transport system substrate-binding protein
MKSSQWLPLGLLIAAPFVHAQVADSRAPDAVVKSTIDEVMRAIKTDAAAQAGDPDGLDRIVAQKFLPSTDFMRTTRLAVGSAWTKATPDQQQALFEQFQTLMAHTYAAQLAQTRGQGVQFNYLPMPALPAGATDAVVRTVVLNNGDTMNIDYRLNKGAAGGWKIYDINMMGAWLIGIYRQQFADQVAKGGIEGLLQFLKAHNER